MSKHKNKEGSGNTNNEGSELTSGSNVRVQKTYKLYIGGKFPRTESGRFYKLSDKKGQLIANMCQGSRKDFRNAVVAARGAQSGWAGRSAYNRGQVIYRIAEMIEARSSQFVEELVLMGYKQKHAEEEVRVSIDRCVYYAGWTDKYQQIFSSVNPVASSHFNFSVLEPSGVVAAFAPEDSGLIGLLSVVLPVIVGGNTCVVLASKDYAISAISLAEVLATSDVPGGVINILTGDREELLSHFSTHKDVNAMIYCGDDKKAIKSIGNHATENLKRVKVYSDKNWLSKSAQGPYRIMDTQEVKTTWHPVGG